MLDFTSYLNNIPMAAVYAMLVGIIHNILGWLENALQDGQIDEYEWTQLGKTMMQYFRYVAILMIGLPLDSSVIAAFGLAALKSSLEKGRVTANP